MSVVNVKKVELRKLGYADFQAWAADIDNVYIGRNMSFYVPGATGSKWANPFSVKRYGREECLRLYRDYILSRPELLNSLEELRGKTLGCWCHPEKCHGDVLIELLNTDLDLC